MRSVVRSQNTICSERIALNRSAYPEVKPSQVQLGLGAFVYAVHNRLKTNLPFHSYRKASTGCWRVARKAG
jgi:hypothetical protein